MSAKLITKYHDNKEVYSDGDVESEILDIFKHNKNPQKKINSLLNNNPSWPVRYHFSPIRENLLNWYDFKKKSSILEIGAGCGAITGVLCNKTSKVVSVELSKIRSEIIYHRHKDKNNLTIIIGNLNNIKLKEKFDYVTLIGVFEYAGKYTQSKKPFEEFLINVKKYLNKDGELIIAIENKFGLKYWSGCKEDHTGLLFDSIENYPTNTGIRTFSKLELENILNKVGFKNINFYYPVPDYKLPTEIFSDLYKPSIRHNIQNGNFPYQDFAQERIHLFNEKLVMDNIIKSENFNFFANSFLVFAKLNHDNIC